MISPLKGHSTAGFFFTKSSKTESRFFRKTETKTQKLRNTKILDFWSSKNFWTTRKKAVLEQFLVFYEMFLENFDYFMLKITVLRHFWSKIFDFKAIIFRKLSNFQKTEQFLDKNWAKNWKTEQKIGKTQKYEIFRFIAILKSVKKKPALILTMTKEVGSQ